MKKSSDIIQERTEIASVDELVEEKPWQDELEIYEKYKATVIIKHLYGPLFFGSTSFFKDQISKLPPGIKALIIRMDRVPYIDQSGLYALEETILELNTKKVEVILTKVQSQPLDMLRSINIVPDLVPEEDLFDSIEDAYAYLKTKLEEV